jgi:biotin/methionine sulfoxide reductase
MRLDVERGEIVNIRNFEKDPGQSHLNSVWPEMVNSPLRVVDPVFRKGWLEGDRGAARGDDVFVRIPWDEVLDTVATELRSVLDAHGASAIFGGSYGWSSAGRVHHARTLLHRFLGCLGPFTTQETNYSFGAAMYLLPFVVGSNSSVSSVVTEWRSVAETTDIILAFGGIPAKNLEVTSGGVTQHLYSEIARMLKARPIQIVNISPYRNDVPEGLAATWLPLRPNTDTALILALCHHLAAGGHADRAFLSTHCVGYERFEAYLLGRSDGSAKSAKWASDITGLSETDIQALADNLKGRRVLLSATWSLQRARHGEQPYWALIALAAMLGQIGLPGSGFAFGYGSSAGLGNPRYETPFFGLPGKKSLGTAIPVARVADMLLEPGNCIRVAGKELIYPDIHLIYWVGGNPFHHHQDLNRLRKAFRKPATVIVHENYWTSTARHADIVLPATITLERNDIGGSSRERYIIAMQKACEPLGQSRDDYDIFADIAERLDCKKFFTEERRSEDWLRWSWSQTRHALDKRGIETPDFETFWQEGYFEMPIPEQPFVMFRAFRENPNQNPLATASGKIELFSEGLHEACGGRQPGHPAWLDPEEWLGSRQATKYPLHLLSPQPAKRLHGQMDASSFNLAGKVNGREKIIIHPDTAAARNIKHGDIVCVFNDRGACFAAADISESIRADVVSLPTGATFDPQGMTDRHSNPNVLTRDIGTSEIGQACSAQSCLVDIRLADHVPTVRIFSPPHIE